MTGLHRLAVLIGGVALVSALGAGAASAASQPIPAPLAADVYGLAVTQQNGPGGVTHRVESTTNLIGPGGPLNVEGGSCNGQLPASCSSPSAAGRATAIILARPVGAGASSVNPTLSVLADSSEGLVADTAGRLVDHDEAFASAQLTYYFSVSANSDILSQSPTVSVNFNGSIESSEFRQYDSPTPISTDGHGEVYLLNDKNVVLFQKADDGGFSVNLELELNALYAITYRVSASSAGGGGVGSATIDPILTLAPEFAANYHVDYSPNLFDAPPAAPEPSTWAMMMLGVFGLGLSLRFRRAATGV